MVHGRLLLRLLLGTQRTGVTALALSTGQVDTEVEELGTKRFHLGLRGGTNIVRRHHGTESSGGANGLQAGDSGAGVAL